jgi:enoyl-CoA hydratase/carnithine racemase
MTGDAPVRVEHHDGVAVVRMAEPQRRNALTARMRLALEEAITAAERDTGVVGLVLAGDACAFCAGGDVSTMLQMTRPEAEERIRAAHRLARLVHECAKPIVAAVDGVCAGAGLSLAALCDLIVAGGDAQFRTAFERVGLMPDLGAAWSIPARIGVQAARRLFLLGGTLTAAEAADLGLCDVLTAPGGAEAEAIALARRLGLSAPGTRRAVRHIFRDVPASFEDALRLEALIQPTLYLSADLAEGIGALRERRDPVWTGR